MNLWQKHLIKTSSHTECPRPQLFYISYRDGDPSWTNWTSSSFTVAEHQPGDLETAVCPWCYSKRERFQDSNYFRCSSGCDKDELFVTLNLCKRREAHPLGAALRNKPLRPSRFGVCETSTYLCDERSARPPLAAAHIPAREGAPRVPTLERYKCC